MVGKDFLNSNFHEKWELHFFIRDVALLIRLKEYTGNTVEKNDKI